MVYTETGTYDKVPQYRCDMTKYYPDACKKVLKELEKINDLEELDSEIESFKYDLEVESENLIKEFMYISNKTFNEAIDDIWDKAKGGIGANA